MEMPGNVLRDVAIRVSKYFRDFLETDFKRQQAPRRRVITMTETGFRAGMRTSPYLTMDRDLWALLSQPTKDDLSLTLTPRKYTRPISEVLLKIIREHIGVIEESSLGRVRASVMNLAATTRPQAIKNPEEWVERIQEDLATAIADQVIRPLIAHLDGPLQAQAYWVIDSLHGAEADLVQRVGGDLARVLPEVLAKLLAAGDAAPLACALEEFLTLEGTRAALMSFFESFAAADAYLEFRDLETYVATGEGLQMYLYIGSMKFGPNTYPLFFLPVDVQRKKDGDGYTLQLVNHLYAHRRAIDFVLAELAAEHNRVWVTPISDRITYIQPEQTIYEVARGMFRDVTNAMDLGGEIELSSSAHDASNTRVRLSSALYLAAAERSDEALLNDYEEIIDLVNKGGSAIVNLFEGIVGGVLMDNPVSIKAAVEDEWESLPMVDRMVFDSPIPLNEEQRKILLAVRRTEGKIIKVSGPPGTGKSHTITAIAADCAFNKKSCLVLSDKAEALDVVYDKLTEAMSRVRNEREFPNPILRLGRHDANFKRLTSTQAVTQVGAYLKAMRANQKQIEAERSGITDSLKGDIAKTIEKLGSVVLADVQAMHHDEEMLRDLSPATLDLLQRSTDDALLPELDAIAPQLGRIEAYLRVVFEEGNFTHQTLLNRAKRDSAVAEYLTGHSATGWSLFESLDAAQLSKIRSILVSYGQLRMPIFGYLFRGSQVRALELQLNQLPATRPMFLKNDGFVLEGVLTGANTLRVKLETAGVGQAMSLAYRSIAGGAKPEPMAALVVKLMALLHRLDPNILDTMLAQPKDESKLWPLAIRFLRSWLATRRAFVEAPQYDYVGTKTHLEKLNTSVMNAHVDGRLIDFMDNNKADAKALAGVISNRQKFPEGKFDKVRESFPVIVASIREFGEFMPLAPDLFDVVVIDEASQVSVAQALPALLRARKVVVLGDDKQFSNVKSANASIMLNEKYRSELVNYFRSHVSQKADVLERLGMFDVKRSILDFASLTASYEIMLLKHFRSYQELIGYSSSTFYGNQLQAIKIRGKPVDQVIRFDQVEVGDAKVTRGTNEAEGQFILERMLKLLHEEDPPTVGVITPFREQQTYLSKMLFSHKEGRAFEDRLRLKVMTFDSCQGEERQVIFYSMVATQNADALNYIFPVSMADAQQAAEEKLKVQRLNVGFSRAQEMIWFVLSKPISEYHGCIKETLNHYANVLEKAAALPDADDTDSASPMERKVVDWFKKTPFYLFHMNDIDLFAQFEIGDYLRQLDPTYQHPAWRVDFLITFHAPKGTVQIVMEYDGFEFHFQKGRNVHVGNHERYLSEADVERQLTLESYGYRFLRINRFNLGKDPVATLSDRLKALVEMALGEPLPSTVDKITEVAAGLANKSKKTCSRCGEIKALTEFFDPALKRGTGRICAACKELGS